jgi:hypothetical protein
MQQRAGDIDAAAQQSMTNTEILRTEGLSRLGTNIARTAVLNDVVESRIVAHRTGDLMGVSSLATTGVFTTLMGGLVTGTVERMNVTAASNAAPVESSTDLLYQGRHLTAAAFRVRNERPAPQVGGSPAASGSTFGTPSGSTTSSTPSAPASQSPPPHSEEGGDVDYGGRHLSRVVQENLLTPFFDSVGVGGATALILSDIYRVLMNVSDPDEEGGVQHSPTNIAFLFAVLVTIGAPVHAIETERIDALRDD